jgi:hypothetical protein
MIAMEVADEHGIKRSAPKADFTYSDLRSLPAVEEH